MTIFFDYSNIYVAMKGSPKTTISISQFKSKALGLLNNLAKTGKAIVVTKHGKPLAKVIPFQSSSKKPTPGKLAGTLLYEGDLIRPLGPQIWKAAKK